MSFYDEFNIDNLTTYDFYEFCNENDIKIKTFKVDSIKLMALR